MKNFQILEIVVMIKDNIPHLQRPLGTIVDVFPEKDGMIRSVNVKTSKSVVNRAIQRL